MKFIKNGVEVILDCPAQYPLKKNYEIVQAKEKSANGITHVENFSVELKTKIYNFVDMSTEDYNKLLDFFVNVAVASLNTFVLENDLGESENVRFLDNKLNFSLTDYNLYSGSFGVENA